MDGRVPSAGTSRSTSKDAVWDPNAFRRTETSRPPMLRWSWIASTISSASMMSPAHVP
ncbi:hypothetical protein CMMCAS06_02600 [Clavibacter michiganensis subsp. michiganensis]|nr:hypothetical protein CMMCAS06_02600 [Clavibacter michiganensis subsp. michiganensis]